MRSDVFPIGLKLEGKLCLVVGSGEGAEGRTRALLASGASVRVISADPTAELDRLAANGEVMLHRRVFEDADLDEVWLAVHTDADPLLSARIFALAEARRVFFCAVDRPESASYSHLGLVKAGLLTVAISTDGRAPALARKLREEFARVFADARIDEFAEDVARLRDRTPPDARRSVLGNAVRGVRFRGRLELGNEGDADLGSSGGRET